jgi:pre-mRNA-splicing factor ATP-dependent RNA helicase DHX16
MKRARDIKDQLIELCKRVEIDYGDESLSTVDDDVFTNVRKAIAAGFFYNTAKLQEKSGSYKLLKSKQGSSTVQIHPNSCFFEQLPRWLIYNELVFTTKEYMRDCIEIKPEWLIELAPHFYKRSDIFGEEEQKAKKVKMPRK